MRLVKRIWLAAMVLMVVWVLKPRAVAQDSFSNPVVARPSADPSVVYVKGLYYSVHSSGCHVEKRPGICLRVAPSLPALRSAQLVPVWLAPDQGPNATELWAPQIRYFEGRWFIYYAADPAMNNEHRLFALVPRDNAHPLGLWQEANTGAPGGQLVTDWKSLWAIDPDVFPATDGHLYLVYSCRQDNSNTPTGNAQSICLAARSDPLHLQVDPATHKAVVELSVPDQHWETRGWPTEEGPFGLAHDGKDYILYSGSFSGTPDQYTEGVLINARPPRANGRNPLTNPAAWVKLGPIFDGHHASYGTASNVLVPSPDGTELWDVYHGTDCLNGCPLERGKTWVDRSDRAQQAWWSATGDLVLGYPVDIRNMDGTGQEVPLPAASRNGHGSSVLPAWGNAFGDAAEGDHTDGLKTGDWISSGAHEVQNGSIHGDRFDQAFSGTNPNWIDRGITARMRLLETGTGGPHARYGLYAAYVDHENWLAAMVDLASCAPGACLATGGMAGGQPLAWMTCTLPATFHAASENTMTVEAVQNRFTVLVNDTTLAGACQNRRVDLSGGQKHAGNGQTGVLVENTRVAFRGFDVVPVVAQDTDSSGVKYGFRQVASGLDLDSGCGAGCRGKTVRGSSPRLSPGDAPYPSLAAKEQLWRTLRRDDGQFAISGDSTGMCLELGPAGDDATHRAVLQQPCSRAAEQSWRFVPTGEGGHVSVRNATGAWVLAGDANEVYAASAADAGAALSWELLQR